MGLLAVVRDRESMTDARLTVVCVAFEPLEALQVLVHYFMAQPLQNFYLHVIHDGPNEEYQALAVASKGRYGDKVDFSATTRRYNDYGHSLREIGLRRCRSEFVLITNGDNYYAPVFLERMFAKVDKDKLDLVLCDMIHSHERPGERSQTSYKPFVTFPSLNHIDMGAFIVRADLAQSAGFADKSYAADGVFVERIMRSGVRPVRWGKVDDVLFVHN